LTSALTKNSSIINKENNINNENYHTPVNNSNFNDTNTNRNDHNHDPESSFMNCSNITSPHHSNNYQKTDSLKSSILNDESVTSILSSPSAILTSPNIFKDTSSLSIIVPKNIDDSMILDIKQEQQPLNLQAPQNIPNSNIENYHEIIHPLDNSNNNNNNNSNSGYISLNLIDNNKNNQNIQPHINNTMNNSIINNSSIFLDITNDLSINNNIIDPEDDIENDAEYDYSINYSHSLLSHRRRSADYPSKRFMRSSMGMYSFSKNIANSSSLFTSSLPPISRPTRVQSLPKLKRNSTGSNIESKRSMVKGQDYIALSQRSFPVRANFIPDISYKDEIKLNVGDLVVITDVYVDEWAKGINIMTNSTGVFPLCYLNTDEPQAQAKTKRFTKIINQEINNNNI
jgi:hypothetical protein